MEREIDALIFGTGFHVTDFPAAQVITGRKGQLLSDVWSEGVRSYLGTNVSGFPNLFFITGPNTGLGHNSMVFMIESHVEYVLGALKALDSGDVGVIDVKPEVMDVYNEQLQTRMKPTVWLNGGCSSWYLDDKGRNVTLWPGATWAFRRRTAKFDLGNYETAAKARTKKPAAAVA